jgi:hypothetical protein
MDFYHLKPVGAIIDRPHDARQAHLNRLSAFFL